MRAIGRVTGTLSAAGRFVAVLCLAAMPLFTAGVARAADAAASNNEGNKLYLQKRYDDALKMYTDAQAAAPGAPALHYNIGNVLFRKGEYDKAIEEYLRAQSKGGRSLSESAVFNRGNAQMMKGEMKDAIGSYIQALRLDPSDADAKRNLELALRLMKQQQQQQQQQKQQDQQQNDQKEPQKIQPSPSQDQNKNQRDDQKPPPKRPGQMSEEEARQILEALRENDKEGLRKHAQAVSPRTRNPEEDW
jgi:tetratricopeptide (TPR) repeat protein